MNDRKEELVRELAELELREEREKGYNPLSVYSTSQLKAELRRRKKEK